MAVPRPEIKAAGGLVGLGGRGIIRAGMADQRSVLKEFRFLDEKRRTQGLSREEQARLDGLRELVGETAPAGARAGFDVNAAAARLRDSLLPAGLRNRPPPPPPEELQPEPLAPDEHLALDVMPSDAAGEWAEPAALGVPAEATDLFFDPASLATDEGAPSAALDGLAWDAPAEQPAHPAAAQWEPNAAEGDPNAAAAWDPNDPNAPAAWDPNAPGMWDPNDPNLPAAWDSNDPNAQPWDAGAASQDPNAPNATYDPGAASWDPNAAPEDPNAAAWDPNADPAAQGWDPATGTWDPSLLAQDPNAFPQDAAAWDPNAVIQDAAAWDPNAVAQDPAAWDPNAVPQDAVAWDPNAGPQDAATGFWDPNAVAQDPATGFWDPSAAPQDPATSPWNPDPNGAFDPAALAVDPSALPGGPETPPAGWPGAAADAGFDPSAPDTLPPLELGPVEAGALGAYDDLSPANAVYDDAALEALLPFDPAAASAIGPNDFGGASEEGFGGASAGFLSAPRGRGEYDDTAGFSASRSAWADPPPAVPEPNAFETAPQLTSAASAEWHPESALESGFELASHGSFDTPEAPAEPAVAAPDPLDLAADPADEAPAAEMAAPFEAAVEPQPAEEPSLEVSLEPSVEVELPALDFDDGATPEPTIAMSLDAAPASARFEPEIPTLDGEDILEEIPPEVLHPAEEAPIAAAVPPVAFDLGEVTAPLPDFAAEAPRDPPPPSPTRLPGPHRVVVHTVEGHVKRGVIEDVDLGATSFALGQPDAGAEVIASDHVKAIFFMLAPGERPPAVDGQRVRVTFRDGRQVAGFSPDYREGATGFFMVPADTRTNTGRIWVYATAVKTVAVG
jgi:hypothetical protein